MASKIHEEIHALVPEPIKKGGYGIYWNERSGRYYVVARHDKLPL